MPRTRREQLTFPINVRQLEVRRVTDLGPGMRRITLSGDQLGAFTTSDGIAVPALRNEGFDDHVKIIVAGAGQDAPVPPIQVEGHLNWRPPGGRPEAKDYTPRRYDPVAGELDLDFVRHGTGPAATWAENAQVGDPAWIAGPKNSALLPRNVDWLLVAGDETALPAIGRLLDELPEDLPATVIVEVSDPSRQIPLTGGPHVDLRWVHRTAAGDDNPLFEAIRALQWREGEVYAWVSGEATALKPIRAHLKHERQVPPDCLEVTGYWKRSAAPSIVSPGNAESAVVEPEVDAHDRLHELADLNGPYALRAAVSCGLIEAVDRGVRTVPELAEATGTHLPTLASLVRFLAVEDVLDVSVDGAVTLGLVGAELVEDDHSLQEYDLSGPRAALDLSVAGLLTTLRSGVASPGADGRLLADRLATDPVLAAAARSSLEDAARWPAPSVADHLDWSAYGSIVAAGPGAGQTVASILRAHPDLKATVVDLPSSLAVVREEVVEPAFADRLTLVEQSPLGPLTVAGDAVLTVGLLERLPDEDSTLVLRQLLAGPYAEVVVVETSTVPGEALDEYLVEEDLRQRCAFGVGVRSTDEVSALVQAAGGTVRDVINVGWDLHLLRIGADRLSR